MFNWRKRKDASLDGSGLNPMPADLRCSFCHKTQADVRKLIAGPEVFICDECVEVCVDIIEDDARLQAGSSSGEQRPKRVARASMNNAALCSLCGIEAAHDELLPIPGRGVLCGRCADAVDDALSRGRPIS